VAEDLATAVVTYGQPFIDHWSDWNTFSREVATSGLLLDNVRFFMLPAVAAVNGDYELADRLIRRNSSARQASRMSTRRGIATSPRSSTGLS